ncbi:hypothetical protein RAC92_15480 [Agrobacterium sp. CR_3]|uniref:hypothetical protein n=1 Tax=unclassified Agrobacterium TaxID=2632611 RepID=UPI0035C25A3A
MFQKLVNPGFFTDMGPLLPTDLAKALTEETLKAALSRQAPAANSARWQRRQL